VYLKRKKCFIGKSSFKPLSIVQGNRDVKVFKTEMHIMQEMRTYVIFQSYISVSEFNMCYLCLACVLWFILHLYCY